MTSATAPAASAASAAPARDAAPRAEAAAARRRLLLAWVGLLLLLALSFGAARLHIGGFNLVASMAIAAIKAGIVAWVFMDLRTASTMVRLAGLAGLVALTLLGVLSMSDFGTRRDERTAWQQPEAVAPRLTQRHEPPPPR